MTAHIHHTSQKSMATGSAWGRLLTIAFLCFVVYYFSNCSRCICRGVDMREIILAIVPVANNCGSNK